MGGGLEVSHRGGWGLFSQHVKSDMYIFVHLANNQCMSTQHIQPPAKKQKQSLFDRYKMTDTQSNISQDKTPAEVLTNYLHIW